MSVVEERRLSSAVPSIVSQNVETRSYLARISQQSQVQIITRHYYTGVPCDTLGYVATVGAMPEPGTQPN